MTNSSAGVKPGFKVIILITGMISGINSGK